MSDNPELKKYLNVESLHLNVVRQEESRDDLAKLLNSEEAVWLRFLLIPEQNGEVSVHFLNGDEHKLKVGYIGKRNKARLLEIMGNHPVTMMGIVEWVGETPKVSFIPRYSL